MEKDRESQKKKIGQSGYVNENCYLAKTLNYPPYKRCQHCELKFRNCLFLHYQITSLVLIFSLFILSFFIEGKISEILIISVFVSVIVYGYFLNRSTDRIIQASFAQRKTNEALEELNKSLEEQVEQRTEKLRKAYQELEKLDKVKSEFLSFASHQVKAPMTIVKGFAQLIYDGTYGKVSVKVKEAAKKIINSANKMIALVGNLLDLRKIDEGKMEYNFTETDVVKLAKDAVEALKPMAQDKKLELTFEGPADEIKINVDALKLGQVIQNFVDNAIKYTDEGWVKAKVEEKENSVLISVSDSGRGISPELRPRLFEQFSRDSAIAKEIQGTGLGLYIAKKIVEAHHGKIWAESEGEGKGASFCVEMMNK